MSNNEGAAPTGEQSSKEAGSATEDLAASGREEQADVPPDGESPELEIPERNGAESSEDPPALGGEAAISDLPPESEVAPSGDVEEHGGAAGVQDPESAKEQALNPDDEGETPADLTADAGETPAGMQDDTVPPSDQAETPAEADAMQYSEVKEELVDDAVAEETTSRAQIKPSGSEILPKPDKSELLTSDSKASFSKGELEPVSVSASKDAASADVVPSETSAAAVAPSEKQIKAFESGTESDAVESERLDLEEVGAGMSQTGPLNPDGLVGTPSTSLAPSGSGAARPPAPPPSEVGVVQERADSKMGLYWQRQLTELKEVEDEEQGSLPGPGDMDHRPDQMGFRAPEEYILRRSQATLPEGASPGVPTDRRGVGPYPMYGASDIDGMDVSDSEEDTPRGQQAYPLYQRPEGMSSGAPSPAPGDGGDWAEPRLESAASPPVSSPRTGSAAGGGDQTLSEISTDGRGKPVLPPDHPLMARFQKALSGLLKRRMEQLDLDLVQLRKEHRAINKHRESTGVQLYERQLQLSKQQQQQQALMLQLKESADARRAAEATLQEVRLSHQENMKRLEADRLREKQLRVDVTNLEKHEYHLKSLENDADTELQLRQKMAERADAEMDKLEQDKQRQDYLIARLTADADRLKTAIRLHQVQARAQSEECSLARQVLAEAQLELETLEMEKKHMQQTWANSLNTMQKRDEEYGKLHNRISKMAADLHTADGEIAGYIRSIHEAQDTNEQLMMQAQRLRNERDKFQRSYEQCVEKFDAQKQDYARFRHILTDTEDKLYQMQLEQKAVERKLKHIIADMEKVTDQKRMTEELIVETMQERLTADSSGKYTAKMVYKTRAVTKLMESQVADVENSITRLLLAVSNASTAMEFMHTIVEQLLEEVSISEETLNRYQLEVHRGNAVIQHKQNKVQELNTKLGVLIAAAGGQELGPLEIMIASLHKAIDQLQNEVDTVQQYYIRLQNNLVSGTQERDALTRVVMTRKKELLILDQRKLRMEDSIDAESSSLHAVELSVKQLRQAVCHLNVKLAGETQLHRQLEANTSVIEYELCHALREVEAACLQMRAEITTKDRQRTQMLCKMAQSGATELLWEQKITLLKQAKDKLKGETGCVAEVQAMRLEIHRMQVRYGQLLREQERLMVEMERAVDRRETIALRAENADRRGRQKAAANFFQRQKRLEDLKRKFKAARRDAAHLSSELARAEHQLQHLDEEGLPHRRAAVAELRQHLDVLQKRIHDAARKRSQNLTRIVLKQQSSKHHQSLLEGHYTCIIRSQTRLDSEVDNTDVKHKSVKMLVRQLLRDKPELAQQLEFLRDLLKV